jgi:hypothetical protein
MLAQVFPIGVFLVSVIVDPFFGFSHIAAEKYTRQESAKRFSVARLASRGSGRKGLREVKIIDRPPITIIDGNRAIGWMF